MSTASLGFEVYCLNVQLIWKQNALCSFSRMILGRLREKGQWGTPSSCLVLCSQVTVIGWLHSDEQSPDVSPSRVGLSSLSDPASTTPGVPSALLQLTCSLPSRDLAHQGGNPLTCLEACQGLWL